MRDCDLWCFEEATGSFEAVGSSSTSGFDPANIRPAGWSSFIRDSGQTVWLSGIEAPNRFRALVQGDSFHGWRPTDGKGPTEVNPRLIEFGVHSCLGMPIRLGDLSGGGLVSPGRGRPDRGPP